MELVTFTVLLFLYVRLIPDNWHLYSNFCHESAILVTIDSFIYLQIYCMTRGPQQWLSVLSVSAYYLCCPAHLQRLHIFSTYPCWISGSCFLTATHTCTDCSNAQPIMIDMSGTVAMEGHRRRPGGGSMTTLCDGCSDCCCPVRI